MSDTKFCVECKHYWKHYCKHPELDRDLVTGRQAHESCQGMRRVGGRCGPSGRWFEPKAEPAPVSASKLDTPKPLTPRINLFTVLGNLFK